MSARTRRAVIVLILLLASAAFILAMYGVVQVLALLLGKTVSTFAFLAWAAIAFPVMCWVGFQQLRNIW